jgi:type IV pilus assembly protein PilW
MYLSKHYQLGFSLLSLMIASAISLFLIGGIGKIYMDGKNAFNAREGLAAATETYRFVFQELRRNLIMAGRGISTSADSVQAYSVDNDENGQRTFPALGRLPDGIVSGAVGSVNAWSPAPEDSSVIAVRYAAGTPPCGADNLVMSNGVVSVRFRVDEAGNMICEVYQNGDIFQSQPIASGVLQMRALYGIDTDTEPDDVANIYVTADGVAPLDWMKVVSIRIGLVVSSGVGYELPYPYRPRTADQLDLLGATYIAPDTNYLYKSASTTISLRNLHHMYRQLSDQ